MALADDLYDLGVKIAEAETYLGKNVDFDRFVRDGSDRYMLYVADIPTPLEFVDVQGAITALDAIMGSPNGAIEYNRQRHIAALQAQIAALGGE